jgi:hypothetical protein
MSLPADILAVTGVGACIGIIAALLVLCGIPQRIRRRRALRRDPYVYYREHDGAPVIVWGCGERKPRTRRHSRERLPLAWWR